MTRANVLEMAKGTDNPEIDRMLGTEGSMGKMLGLDARWAVRAIAAEGNYAEVFDKYLGARQPARPAARPQCALPRRRYPLFTPAPVNGNAVALRPAFIPTGAARSAVERRYLSRTGGVRAGRFLRSASLRSK